MKGITILLFILLQVAWVTAQNRKSIEIDIMGRYDKHADYTTRFFDRTFTDDVRLWGLSYGANLNYLQPFTQRMKIKIGIGYYRLVMDKVRSSTRVNTVAPARTIDYNHPTGIQPLFSTNYYHYNNLVFTSGLAWEGKIGRRWNYNAGGDFSYLYTFSQLYNIGYDDSKFRTRRRHQLGVAVSSYIGMIRHFEQGRYYINPKIIVPVYQQLRGDIVFGERDHVRMNKWLNGVGLAVAVGRYF